ncbi:hypothetical protein J3R30DRAFT_3400015 [Lentinula aciculospora]|uniref:Uncharacterized protein n=1 Tax=Lentinula aciculospora TaxID=153920 RepID=A0A9W9AUN8_9AGAR|nr:hypothetical protein J3R30DRAFT_3400015 [Lentinula aciculospora]
MSPFLIAKACEKSAGIRAAQEDLPTLELRIEISPDSNRHTEILIGIRRPPSPEIYLELIHYFKPLHDSSDRNRNTWYREAENCQLFRASPKTSKIHLSTRDKVANAMLVCLLSGPLGNVAEVFHSPGLKLGELRANGDEYTHILFIELIFSLTGASCSQDPYGKPPNLSKLAIFTHSRYRYRVLDPYDLLATEWSKLDRYRSLTIQTNHPRVSQPHSQSFFTSLDGLEFYNTVGDISSTWTTPSLKEIHLHNAELLGKREGRPVLFSIFKFGQVFADVYAILVEYTILDFHDFPHLVSVDQEGSVFRFISVLSVECIRYKLPASASTTENLPLVRVYSTNDNSPDWWIS